MDMRWPSYRDEIEAIHHEKKRLAIERALQSPFWKKRMPPLKLDRLDDPDEWRKIPVLTKDDLRQIAPERFHDEFCIQPRTRVDARPEEVYPAIGPATRVGYMISTP